ncbi:MAG: hypothetical protein MJZ34_08925 [Paludibacteraceae bacterium]|nr:hypothetical protein [Paludibacteraceae bacterium]
MSIAVPNDIFVEIAIKGLGWKPIIELPRLWGDEGVEETKEDDKTQIKIEKSEFLKMAKEGVEIAKISNPSGSACNICSRNTLYLLTRDSVLFPYEGSEYHIPEKNYEKVYIKGLTTNDGRAKKIKEDFEKPTVPYSQRFDLIEKQEEETWQDFLARIQDEANNGCIIIGAMVDSHNNSGHIMVVVPGEMIDTENENKWGDSFKKRNITKVPIVVECGQGVRNFAAPLCKNVDARGAIERLKWYKYKLAK